MKHYETHFDEYIATSREINFHPELDEVYDNFPCELTEMSNVIMYGKSGIGKYTQALKLINKYSPSHLKYEKKTSVTMNKQEYIIKISDVHFEIDMSLLGCNAKVLWHEMYNHIVDIIKNRPFKSGVILCKNMHMINNDLLDIFYSYIQNNCIGGCVDIRYVFISESICFLPENIINCCEIIGLSTPDEKLMKKHLKKMGSVVSNAQYTSKTNNIKSLIFNNE